MIYSTSAFTASTPAPCSPMPCSPDAGRTTHASSTRSNSGQRHPHVALQSGPHHAPQQRATEYDAAVVPKLDTLVARSERRGMRVFSDGIAGLLKSDCDDEKGDLRCTKRLRRVIKNTHIWQVIKYK
jgi:hypothetical protein